MCFERRHFDDDNRTMMNDTCEPVIADQRVPVSDLVLELILVVLILLFSTVTGYIARKKISKRRRYHERTSETLTADTETLLGKLGDKAKRQYMKKCNKEFVDCVSECAKRLRGNVPLTSNQTTKLRRNKKNLRSLATKKTSLKKKRQILQKGGFLAALLPPVLSLLGAALSGVIRDALR